jgi:flagellar motility protein MotE (MotC chaperone)
MSDYKQHFKKLNQNKKSPKRKMSLHYKTNAVKNGSSVVHWLSFICLSGFCLALYGFLYPEQLETLPTRLKVSFFSQSLASETATSATPPAKKEEKKSSTETSPSVAVTDPQAPAVQEKQSHVEQLMEKEKELDEREKHVEEMEAKLQQQKLELDEKIKVLEQARRDIATKLETRVAQDQETIDKLVGVYSNMKPQNAAIVISKLDEELAVSVLKKMKKQDAGAIMNYMDPQKTKVLSEKYSGY